MKPKARFTSFVAVMSVGGLLLAGCTSSYWIADADREVAEILEERNLAVLGQREDHVIFPKPEAEEDDPTLKREETDSGLPPLSVGLDRALAIAVKSNRRYLGRQESLYLAGLSLSLTRFNFGPALNSTISYLYSDAENQVGAHGVSTGFNVSQILPTGGVLSFTSSLSGSFPEGGVSGGDNNFAGSANVRLSQPLLRGAGYLVSHESLTQAERSMVYAIRDFELFRQDFSIEVAQSFYNLVSQQTSLANQQKRYDDAVFDRKKSEALRSVDRTDDQAVFLAQRAENVAQDDLIDARADYDRRVDDFKILLGFSTSRRIVIESEDPPFDIVRIDRDSAVEAARFNRLDIQTARERLDDTARGVKIAEDGLLPDLGLDLSYGQMGSGGILARAAPDEYGYSIGLVFDVPLQRKAERNAYRSAVISYEQAKRDFSLTLDSLELSIRDQLRQLRSTEQRINLQGLQIGQEERAVAVTEIRYETGEAQNRDLLDARQSLTDRRNELVQLNVNHFIGRLTLLRSLGVLFIGDEGKWR